MRIFVLGAGLALALSGCAGLNAGPLASAADVAGAPPPAIVANATTLDEKAVIGLETAYTVAAKAASLAIRTGAVGDPAKVRRIGELDNRAYAALGVLRAAYRAGNATSYAAAFTDANAALIALNGLL